MVGRFSAVLSATSAWAIRRSSLTISSSKSMIRDLRYLLLDSSDQCRVPYFVTHKKLSLSCTDQRSSNRRNLYAVLSSTLG